MVLACSDYDPFFLTLAIPRNDSDCIHTHYQRMHDTFCIRQEGIMDRLPLIPDPTTSDFLNAYGPAMVQQQAPRGLAWYLLLSTHPDIVPDNLGCCFTYAAITWRPGVSQRSFRITTPTRTFWLKNVSAQRILSDEAGQAFPLVWSVRAHRPSHAALNKLSGAKATPTIV